jgi:membrane-bound lytic murein transglycosylase B
MPFRSVYILSVLVILMFGASAQAQDEAFETWLATFKNNAIAKGISAQTLDDAFAGIEPDETVVKLDRKQPEGQITLEKYLNNTISDRRIRIGREMLREHAEVLSRVSKRYGVQPKYIVALWGIESDFGNHQGNFSTIQSLATLAYEGRRAEFFSNELLSALKILESEKLPRDELTGSWAGVMGNCQFIPSTFLRYAVDADGDGHRDIWNNTDDTFASIANYLQALGWDDSFEVMHEAVTPDNFNANEASIDKAHSADYWSKRGFSVSSGNGMQRLGGSQLLYAVYLSKEDQAEGNTVLVTSNFKALLQWNRSRYFAAAVSKLADAIEEQ